MKITLDLESTFPGLRVVEFKMEGLTALESHPALLEFRRQVQEGVRRKTPSIEEVKNQPIFRAYRDFFWRVGIDPTKIRPAGEALTRKILGGRELPTINSIVDAYNLASVETSIAIAAFDLSAISEDALLMRIAVSGEPFHGIGMDAPSALTGAEVVIEDQKSRKLIAVYPYRDSDESKITEKTTSVLFMMCGVPGIDDESLQLAATLTRLYVGRFCSHAQVAP